MRGLSQILSHKCDPLRIPFRIDQVAKVQIPTMPAIIEFDLVFKLNQS